MKDPDTTELKRQLETILEGVWHSRSVSDVVPELVALITKREAEAYRAGQIAELKTVNNPEYLEVLGMQYVIDRLAELQSDNGEEG